MFFSPSIILWPLTFFWLPAPKLGTTGLNHKPQNGSNINQLENSVHWNIYFTIYCYVTSVGRFKQLGKSTIMRCINRANAFKVGGWHPYMLGGLPGGFSRIFGGPGTPLWWTTNHSVELEMDSLSFVNNVWWDTFWFWRGLVQRAQAVFSHLGVVLWIVLYVPWCRSI